MCDLRLANAFTNTVIALTILLHLCINGCICIRSSNRRRICEYSD